MTVSEQIVFRRSPAWVQFRQRLLENRGYRCECCGIPKKKGLQIHHIYPGNYDDTSNMDHFAVLCSTCHRTVERMSIRFKGKNANSIRRPEVWIALYGHYFPRYPGDL